MRFGFNDQAGHLTPATEATRSFVTGSRIPVPAGIDMGTVDIYAYALAHTTPIFCVYGTGSNPDGALFAWTAETIAHRYPGCIIQAFNEPNTPTYGSVAPATVRAITAQARAAVGRPIIGPSISPVSNWKDYFRGVYPIPGVEPALHLYPSKTDWAAEVDNHIALAKLQGSPWHVTECGMGREHYGSAQRELSVKLYKKIAAKGARDCIFHSLTRLPGDWEDRQRLWAVEDDNSLSPIGRVLRDQRT